MPRWTLLVAVPGEGMRNRETIITAALRAVGVEVIECHHEDLVEHGEGLRECCPTRSAADSDHARDCPLLTQVVGGACVGSLESESLFEFTLDDGQRVHGLCVDVALGDRDDPGQIIIESADGETQPLGINSITGFEEIDA
jgi:hypothetical protein